MSTRTAASTSVRRSSTARDLSAGATSRRAVGEVVDVAVGMLEQDGSDIVDGNMDGVCYSRDG